MNVFEIIPRESNEHRAGQFTLLINGVETEYTCDPGQFAPTALRLASLEGLGPTEAALFTEEYGKQRAVTALGRVVERIKQGRIFPGGVPLSLRGLPNGPFMDGVKSSDKLSPRGRESLAVEKFLNRGRLNGLSASERKARKQDRDSKKDHVAEWHVRRHELVRKMQEELAQIEADIAKSPDNKKLIRLRDSLASQLNSMIGPQMASHGFQYAYGQYLQGAIDLVNDDIRIVPCMTNTTVDTERDAKDMVSDFTTLDEFDGSGYSTGGQALDSQAVNIDDANDRAEFDAADEAATLGAGTRSIQGNLLIKFDTSLNNSVPLHWIEYASNKTPDGSTFTVQFNAEGILQATDG